MKQTYTRRDKGRAVFLAALMVLSVFAMSASFAGAAAADVSEVTVTPTTVNLADEDPDNVTVDVTHAEEDTQVAIAIADEDGEVVHSELATNVNGDTTTFDNIDVSDLDEGEYTVYAIAGVDLTAPDVGDDIGDLGDGPIATFTISAPEPSEPNGQFNESVYQEEAGDTAEFTVELENADSGTVTLEEANTNYEAELEVEDGNDDGEVTVNLDTYLAGSGEDGTFSAADDADSVTVVNENAEFNYDEGERLLPAEFNMELLVNGDRVDVGILKLTEGSIDSVSSGTAPSDADLNDVDSIVESATESDEIAEGDRVLFSFEASGVFGAIDAGEFDENFDLILEQTDDPYDADPLEEGDDYSIVEDAENDRFFVVLNEDVELEAGEDYELRLEPAADEDGNVDSLYFINGEEYKKGSGVIVSNQFSIVERMVEFAGMDKEDVLRVSISEEATISGETTVAPGSDIRVTIEDGDEVPFLMTATAEVNEDGTFTATFDTSEQEVGQEFEATAEVLQLLEDGDVSTTVDAVFVESADDGEEKSDDKKSDDKKSDDKKSDDKKNDGEYQPDGDEKDNGEEKSDDKQNDNNDDKQNDNNDNKSDDNKSDDEQNDNNNDDDEQPGSPADEQPGFGIAVALIALLAAAGIALRRQ